jgi:hypothetical protein
VDGDASDGSTGDDEHTDRAAGGLMGFIQDAFNDASGSVARKGKPAPKKKPAPRKPRASAAPAPKRSSGLLADAAAAVQGSVSGTARAAKQGKTPAQTERAVERDTQRYRRTEAIRSYLDAPRSERSKQAAAAQRRVEGGRGSERDKLIVETHARRTKNDSGRSASVVRAANARHDAEVQADAGNTAVLGLIDRLGKQRLSVETESSPARRLREIAGGTFDAPKAAVNAAGDAAIAASHGVTSLSKVRLLPESGADRTTKQAGLDPTSAAKALALPVSVSANVAKVVADDPKQGLRAVGDIAGMVKDIPAGVIEAAKDPAGAGKQVLADYRRRYGPLIAGRDEEFRARLKKEGIAPEVVDVLGSFTTGGGATATSGAARAVAKTTKTGTRINRAANRVNDFVREDRPDRLVAPNRAVPQRKSKTLPLLAVQRTTDARRRARVVREQRQAIEAREPLPTPRTTADAKKVRKAQAKRAQGGGKGVRGIIPGDGQVVPLTAKARSRDLRKATARISSTGFRRMERLSNELSRDAERRFNGLKVPEQRAAVYALEGTINVSDPAASIKAVDRRVTQITAERNRMRRDEPERWDAEYGPLVNDPDLDELVRLRELKGLLQTSPDKVLTPKLRAFIDGERGRRAQVEEVAGDSLRPSTVLARRFAPAGELTGTREAYAPRRAALERLEKATPETALRQIGVELKRARAGRDATAGTSPRRARELAAEARAVRQIAESHPPNKRIPADVLDRARTIEAERFVKATRTAARGHGLGDIDPTYVLHRKRDTGGAGSFATGGAEKGAVAAAKKSDMSLFQKGIRDTSGRAYALGIQESIKRSVQWRMVNELMQDLVPAWGKNGGKGFTLKDWQGASRRQVLDPQDWAAYRPRREEVDPDGPVVAHDVGALPDGDLVGLQDLPTVNWDAHDRFYVIPVQALNEMKRATGPLDTAARGVSRFTGVQSQLLLASNPAYGIRQVAQTVPMVLVQVGAKWVDPVMWRNLKAYRQAAKLNPAQFRDVKDVLGVRSKSADAVRSTRQGAQAFDVRKFEGALVHQWGGLFGASARDWWVAPRRSPGPAGTASQAARTAGRGVLAPFRLIRDGNMALDAWQDRLGRTLALAAEDARMANSKRWAAGLAEQAGAAAREVGPLAAALSLPEAELAKIARTADFRHMAFDAADGVTRLLGDYSNYTQLEQRVGRSLVPFYGFARHSTRLLLHVLPIEHPFTFAAALSLSGVAGRDKERMLRDYMKKIGREGDIPEMLAGLVLVSKGGGGLEVVDARWLNPLTGPAFELLAEGPSDATSSVFTPLLKAGVEDLTQTNLFTKNRLSNAQGAVDDQSNPLTGTDQLRVLLNRFGGSLFPYRVANDLLNGKRGKLTDTSLLFAPQEYPYKSKGGIARQNQRKADQADYSTSERLLDAAIPGRAKPATSLLNQAEYAEQAKNAGKKTPRKRSTTSSGGSFGGSSGFGGTGGFGGGGGF